LVAELPVYHEIKRKFPTAPNRMDAMLEAVATAFAEQRIDRTDGVRIDWPDGWALVRPSNTEPIARLQVEAATTSRAAELAAAVQQAIDAAAKRRPPTKRAKKK
jgi:phosphomannomutase